MFAHAFVWFLAWRKNKLRRLPIVRLITREGLKGLSILVGESIYSLRIPTKRSNAFYSYGGGHHRSRRDGQPQRHYHGCPRRPLSVRRRGVFFFQPLQISDDIGFTGLSFWYFPQS